MSKKRFRPRCSLILLAFLTAAAVLSAAPPPKLVLAIVIDQFRYDYLLRFRADYTSGLKKILEQGAVFDDAHHIHYPTVTAVGHSTSSTLANAAAL